MPKSDETNDSTSRCLRCGEPVSRGWPYTIGQKIEGVEMTFSAPTAAECLEMAEFFLSAVGPSPKERAAESAEAGS